MERMGWMFCEHVFQSGERITVFLLNYMLPWPWQYAVMMLSSIQLCNNTASPSPTPLGKA